MDKGTEYHLLEWRSAETGYPGLGAGTRKDGEGDNAIRGRGGEAGRITADDEESVVLIKAISIFIKELR